jgi:Undecaprenyl-phosphate glucose phosphotransferase
MSHRGPLEEQSTISSVVLRSADILCVIASSVAAFIWRHGYVPMPVQYHVAMIIAVLLALIVFPRAGLYRLWRRRAILQHARALATAWIGVCVILVVIAFTMKISADFSRAWMILWILHGYVALLAVHILMCHTLAWLGKAGWNQRKVIVIGEGRLAQDVAQRLATSSWLGLKVVAVIDTSNSQSQHLLSAPDGECDLSQLSKFVDDQHIDEVWLAPSRRVHHTVKSVFHALRDSTVPLRFVPDVFGADFLNYNLTTVAGLPVLDLLSSPMVGVNRLLKAIEDRGLALIILVLLAPLLVLLALGVKLSSAGPIIFRQRRHGWDGQPFTVYKFRTMTVHTEPSNQITQASRADPRVTHFGAFLRRTSLDELPQLVNVLQGHMSIVGPRPHALYHNDYYKESIEWFMQRHKVKPGITGWAQVNGWRGETDSLDKMKNRLDHDLYYIHNWSLLFDLKIMLLTLVKGFSHENAY